MTRDRLLDWLWWHGVCSHIIDWVKTTPGTPEELWGLCRRGDWMRLVLRHIDCADDTAHADAAADADDAAYHATFDDAANAIRKAVPWSRVSKLLDGVTV